MKINLLLVAALLLSPALLWAQSIDDEISLIQSAFGMERRALIEEYMGYDRNDQFWSVYNAYETERRELIKQRIKTINDYLENFESLTDAQADAIAKSIIRNNASIAALHKKYQKRFNKVVSPTETAKFLQLDSFIQNTILLAIAESLPFIGEK
ncbi:MAG: hypothetical protein ACXIUD_15600 [Mongoliitalea sp.]